MLKNSEQRFFYVWSGADFPFVNLLSVSLTLKHHPEAQVDIYVVGDRPLTAWFAVLEQIPHVSIRYISGNDVIEMLPSHLQVVARTFNNLSPTAHSARSNILRYAILYLYGGVYLDFDVLLRRSMDSLMGYEVFAGEELVWADDEARLRGRKLLYLAPRNIVWALSHAVMWCDAHIFKGQLRTASLLAPTFGMWSTFQMNNAVMGSSAGAELIEALLMGAVESDTNIRYATGPTLIERVFATSPASATPLPSESFYVVPPGQSYRFFYDQVLELPDSTFGIHYAASNHSAFVNSLTPESIVEYSPMTVMGSLLRSGFTHLQLLLGESEEELMYA
jgi:hypothetical protein